jgi:hypothetical protein
VSERIAPKPRKKFPEDVIPYFAGMGELRAVALTSEIFQQRVQAGFNRVKRLNAESGITILSDGSEIVYPVLDLGGRFPEHIGDVSLGVVPATRMSDPSINWLIHHGVAAERYFMLARLHFHPDYRPFSQADIENYEALQQKNLQKLAAHKGYVPDLYYGIFMPNWRGSVLNQMTLYMLNGPATSNEYQAEDFSGLSFGDQQELLQASGINVDIVDLPIVRGKVQFDPLKERLLGIVS